MAIRLGHKESQCPLTHSLIITHYLSSLQSPLTSHLHSLSLSLSFPPETDPWRFHPTFCPLAINASLPHSRPLLSQRSGFAAFSPSGFRRSSQNPSAHLLIHSMALCLSPHRTLWLVSVAVWLRAIFAEYFSLLPSPHPWDLVSSLQPLSCPSLFFISKACALLPSLFGSHALRINL
jgi:hypothetical protein